MALTDIAVERKRGLQARLRRAKPWNPMAASDLRLLDMLEAAVPCYWHRRALQMNFEAAETFPRDALVARSDLLAPVQWWYLDLPGREENIAGAPNYAESPEALLIMDGAKIGPRYATSLVIVLFSMIKLNELRNPRLAVPIASWVAGWHFSDPWGKAGIESFIAAEPLEEAELSRAGALVRFVASGVFWLRSKVARIENAALDRHTRRRQSLAIDHHDATVRVVTLREYEGSEHVAVDGDRDVHWSCRWHVKQHWRNQYLPSTHDHRPTLVSEHVKGPADKPFRVPSVRYKIDR